MKNTYMKMTFILGGLLLLGSGCSKLLNQQPQAAASNDTYWKTENDAVQAVNNCYTYLRDFDTDIFLTCATDNSYAWSSWPVDITAVGNGSATTAQGVFDHYWQHSYAAIASCNNVLDNIDKIQDPALTASLKTRLEAEVRFIRAWYYQVLMMLYGNVPLIRHVQTNSSEFDVARSPQDSVASFIVSELDAISSQLPLSYNSSDQGRITRGAALALKARVLLYEGKWTEAAAAAKAVMDLNMYSIDQNGFSSLFDGTNKNSPEIIFQANYLKGTATDAIATWVGGPSLGGWSEVTPTQSLVDAYECTDGKTISQSPLYDPNNPFKNRDPRLAYTVILPGSVVNGKTIDVTDPNSIDALGKNNASFTGYYYNKYIPADISGSWYNNSYVNEVFIRYAEVLLTYAEAKIEANNIDQSVYDAINQVRQRTGVNMPPLLPSMSQSALRQAVRNERDVEFAEEPFIHLFDIRRWKTASTVMNGNVYGILNNFDNTRADYGKHVLIESRTFTTKDYLWPIPQNEMDINSKLTQNPGW